MEYEYSGTYMGAKADLHNYHPVSLLDTSEKLDGLPSWLHPSSHLLCAKERLSGGETGRFRPGLSGPATLPCEETLGEARSPAPTVVGADQLDRRRGEQAIAPQRVSSPALTVAGADQLGQGQGKRAIAPQPAGRGTSTRPGGWDEGAPEALGKLFEAGWSRRAGVRGEGRSQNLWRLRGTVREAEEEKREGKVAVKETEKAAERGTEEDRGESHREGS
uniref:Uncharacterized protein n=1 Tax=Sphaerodactylus townsendi TaxID=933632 RepID=A0ACB8FV91_9SAUR